MSVDRVVRFGTGVVAPSRVVLGNAVRKYFDEIAVAHWYQDCLFCTIVGRVSRLSGSSAFDDRDRYIEVRLEDDCIHVRTRIADEATRALADGLAAVLAYHFHGRRDN